MRRDVASLRTFYGGPLGRAALDMVERKLVEAWGEARGLDVLGVGYATPFLEPFNALARRVVAAMPAGQGVEPWPQGDLNLACLSGELSLPFQNALFDRVALVHGLEESEDPTALLAEIRRVMSPSGRLIAVVANRCGWWSRSETTPFGYGPPFSRCQLEEAVRDQIGRAALDLGDQLADISRIVLQVAVQQRQSPAPGCVQARVEPQHVLPCNDAVRAPCRQCT